MDHLWSCIRANPGGREETVDGRLFWSLYLGTFYSLAALGWGGEGMRDMHEVRQAQRPPRTLESDPLPGVVLESREGGPCQALLAA